MTKSTGSRRNDAVIDSLSRVAAAPIDAVEPRLPDLETRLRLAIAADTDRDVSVLLSVAPDDRRRVTRARRFVALASAACVVALISVAVLARTSPSDDVVLAAVSSVSVVLPDGEVVDGAEGLAVPEGALLDVDGFVVIDGRRFGPGLYRVAGDGGVVEVVGAEVTETSVLGNGGAPADPVVGDGDVTPGADDGVVTARTTTTTTTGPAPSTTVSRPPNESRPRPTVRPATTLPDQVPSTAPPATRPPPTVTRTTEITTEPLRPAPTSPAASPASSTTSTSPTTSTTTTIVRRSDTPVDRSGGRSD